MKKNKVLPAHCKSTRKAASERTEKGKSLNGKIHFRLFRGYKLCTYLRILLLFYIISVGCLYRSISLVMSTIFSDRWLVLASLCMYTYKLLLKRSCLCHVKISFTFDNKVTWSAEIKRKKINFPKIYIKLLLEAMCNFKWIDWLFVWSLSYTLYTEWCKYIMRMYWNVFEFSFTPA